MIPGVNESAALYRRAAFFRMRVIAPRMHYRPAQWYAGKQARGKSGLRRVWTRRGAERRSKAGRRPPPPPPPRPLCRAAKISRGRVGLLGQAACAAGMRSDHSGWGRALALGGSQAASGSAGRVPGRSSQAHRRPPWPTTPPASSGTNRPLGLI